jgi:thymidylate synthase (FAD)
MSEFTPGVSLLNITPNAEDLIVYQARPHNPTSENKERLIRYLIKHKHWSPFEMVHLTFEIRTQRDIAAQILRHRSFSFQEFSQRYADASEIGFSLPEMRLQDPKNRQSSHETEVPSDVTGRIERYLEYGQFLYQYLLSSGYAKETARRILPLCQNTRLFMSGSLRSWLHYVEVRTHPGVQKEHRLLAEEIKEVLKVEVPNVYQAMFQPIATPPTEECQSRLSVMGSIGLRMQRLIHRLFR